ncbi:MAG: peptidoglycan DD-metalloendopeptidase family protein [Alphaproteobacteria bacterium]|nr:peptidoglycan DD-metalloendopeptidase family protein [Alphaproteobacteria bacterium]
MKKIIGILLLTAFVSACSAMNWWGRSGTITVKKGDTLYSISRSYNVPIKDLINANRLVAPYTLYVGQKLRLPAKHYHTVQRGESLYGISRQYNVDITTLSKINNLKTPYSLSVGQKLLLPASVSSAAPAATVSSAAKTASNTQKTSVASTSSVAAKQTYSAPASSAPVKNRTGKFVWPVRGTIISGYGNLGSGRKNDGINIKAALGTAVVAADGGTVAYAGNELKGFGNLILIKHNDGWITAYAHNDKLLVRKGQKVTRGEKIATVGSTGSVTSPQLHFEVRQGKKAVNPRSYLP